MEDAAGARVAAGQGARRAAPRDRARHAEQPVLPGDPARRPSSTSWSQLHQSFVHAGQRLHARRDVPAGGRHEGARAAAARRRSGDARSATDETVKADWRAKNAAVLEKRLATIQDIQNFLARARGQMNLIENTVRLLRDQALTMTSPGQLTEQLDDLLTGVEAVQQTREGHRGDLQPEDGADRADRRSGRRDGPGRRAGARAELSAARAAPTAAAWGPARAAAGRGAAGSARRGHLRRSPRRLRRLSARR